MKKRIFFAAGVAALVLILCLSVFFVVKYSKPPGVEGLMTTRLPQAGRPQTTLRNVTSDPVKFTVKHLTGKIPDQKRILNPDALERFPAGIPIQITFTRGGQPVRRNLASGKPYCFRFDSKQLLQIYPGSHSREDVPDLAPFVPTPPAVLERMLEMASVGPADVLYDIGCGDGRIVIAAAKKRGARGVGIDIDRTLIDAGRLAALVENVEDRVQFLCQDAFQTDISEATVVTAYLLPESLALLRPKFEKELKPGTRVVTHDYSIPGWDDKRIGSDSLDEQGVHTHSIFLYRR